MVRREYVGNAPATTLNGAIVAGSTEIQITDGTDWPTGSTGPFVVIIDRGEADEEKVLITSRTDNTLNVSSRGFDSTTAAAHADGATIEHGLSATDIDEVNQHVFDTGQDDHTQYLNTTRHDVEARHTFTAALGTPAAPADITGETHTASAGSGDNPAREDHIHAWDDVAWEDYTPSNTNVTVGNGTQVARFMRIGRTIHFTYSLAFGSTTAFTGTVLIGLPVELHIAGAIARQVGTGFAQDAGTAGNNVVLHGRSNGTQQIRPYSPGNTVVNATVPFTWASGDLFFMNGTYEAEAGSS